jgi:hypothetical protein
LAKLKFSCEQSDTFRVNVNNRHAGRKLAKIASLASRANKAEKAKKIKK